MRVVVGPVLVHDRICRIVSAVDSLLEVEEWMGRWWEPSSIPLTLAGSAPLADAEALNAQGVPPDEWMPALDAPMRVNIEALMRADAREDTAPVQLDVSVHRGEEPRVREYPGNARFGLPSRVDPADGAPPGARRSRRRRDAR